MVMYLATSSAEFELDVRHSRFFARAWPVTSEAEAATRIRASSDRGATHNCWAWRIDDNHRVNDDGEPGGTAGRPILSAIDHAGFIRVGVLVTRWFGGIKLGTGGLTRAYHAAASGCLALLEKSEWVPMVRLRLDVPFDCLGAVYAMLPGFRAVRKTEAYPGTTAAITVELPQASRDAFCHALREATRGAVRHTEIT